MVLLETLDDGTERIEMLIVVHPIRPEISIKLDVVVPGVVFENGSLHHEIKADDLNQTGEYKVVFLRSSDVKASVCHILRVWQDDYILGYH